MYVVRDKGREFYRGDWWAAAWEKALKQDRCTISIQQPCDPWPMYGFLNDFVQVAGIGLHNGRVWAWEWSKGRCAFDHAAA